MEVKARLNNYRISSRKARLLADQIRGKGVEDALTILGDRQAVLANELTKLHESVLRGHLSELVGILEDEAPRGEYVVVIAGADEKRDAE